MTTEYKKWTIQTLQHRRQLDDYWVQVVDNINLQHRRQLDDYWVQVVDNINLQHRIQLDDY